MPKLRRSNLKTPKGEQRGLICPGCGCQHFYVVRLFHRTDKVLVRLRECRHCGKRIRTRETIA